MKNIRALLALAGLSCIGAGDPGDDALVRQFRDPPLSARPQLWWHWVGGNVTPDGIHADLAWMHRIGIGGIHVFDVDLHQRRRVEAPLRYMTPEWRSAFRQAVNEARANGMSLGIAASPGWSETGAPWVEPRDGMKKLVWSETTVLGGQMLHLTLPALPDRAGPMQDASAASDSYAAAARQPAPLAVDVAILAIPLPRGDEVSHGILHSSDASTDTKVLHDQRLATGADFPAGESWLRYDFQRPTLVRSAVLGRSASTLIEPSNFAPVLEADDGGGFRTIAKFAAGTAPQQTLSFPPVRARRFRIRFMAGAEGAHVTEFRLLGHTQVNRFEDKAGFGQVSDPGALATPTSGGVAPGAIVNLSSRLDPAGRLRWKAPPGRWRVIRFGWSLTGKVNHPSLPEATGLEVDKLDASAVERYMTRYLDQMAQAAPLGPTGVTAVTLDSIEAGAQNWTPGFIAAFRSRRGYDPIPYLPVMTGLIVGDAARSDRFLFDVRRTLGELLVDAHYATIARVVHARGLTLYGEAMEFARTMEGDDMAMRMPVDVPMAAMWAFSPSTGPEPTALADMRGAASVAHLYGKPLVAAELLTSFDALWRYAPSDLRPMIDRAFGAGVNLPVIHSSVHQPQAVCREPGLTLGTFGQTFNRCETWAELARPWMDYIARTAFLLQQGTAKADVLYFPGEDAPLVARYAAGPPRDVPQNNGWDYLDVATLGRLRVDRGSIVAPGGARYRLLWLGPASGRMTLPVLRSIAALVRAGAAVGGARPTESPTLADDPAALRRETATLWASRRIIAATTADHALAAAGIGPAYRAGADVDVVQRRIGDRDIYFVANHGSTRLGGVWFSVSDRIPAIWRAEDGTTEAPRWQRDGAGTRVSLDLVPGRSVFVVFNRTGSNRQTPSTERDFGRISAWTLAFPGSAPRPVSLGSWTTLDPAARAFAGTACYAATASMDAAPSDGRRVMLDLGGVGDVAQVYINGTPAGILWEAPWRVEGTGLLRSGANRIKVCVTNLWTNHIVSAGVPRPSGLFGPVRLVELR